MNRPLLLKNPVQYYPWGSKTAIPELLGTAPDGKPQAELWMGDHPKAPSLAAVEGVWIPLPRIIAADPAGILGKPVVSAFGHRLPFLFKVLAAARPLSIQAHPDKRRAREGFARETALGIPLDAPRRSYRDGNHKPECICAVTPFTALNGFRPVEAVRTALAGLCPETLRTECGRLAAPDAGAGLRDFFGALLRLSTARRIGVIAEAVAQAGRGAVEPCVAEWVTRLHRAYPEDIGVLAPAFLNLVRLAPGEAMFLSSGRLHAYLEGTGMELMANSDNVLRGGLTSKHVDIDELLTVLRFEETRVEILRPGPRRIGEWVYQTPAREFELAAVRVETDAVFESGPRAAVELLFCLQGRAVVCGQDAAHGREICRGDTLLLPAAMGAYRVSGRARLFKAGIAAAGF